VSAESFDYYGTLGSDVGFGYLDQKLNAPKQLHPQLILNGPDSTVLQALRFELRRASSFTFSVAFISAGGIAILKQALTEFIGVGQIITSDYLGFNSPNAFYELLALEDLGIEVRRHTHGAFHPKGYIFKGEGGLTAILGSSNLTESALVSNHEWNIRVSASTDSDLAAQFTNLLDAGVDQSTPLTSDWVKDYELSWTPPAITARRPVASKFGEDERAYEIEPNEMQVAALQSIASLRENGARRGLVISATGTGKTILAALDVRASAPSRVLFVAHREQILDRAIEEFCRVLGNGREEYGKVVGKSRELDRRFVFSTIQTLSRPDILAQIDPTAFDHVLIDEVHRAAAPSYQRLIEHLSPQFLLGLTATPERSDGTSIFELFDYNVPYEIRLGAALEQNMLAPFHYYGVADITFEDGVTTTDTTPLLRLVSRERVDYVLQAISRYGQAGVHPRGLIFCSRKEEARELARHLNQRKLRGRVLRTVALTGEDDVAERERQVQRLERGDLDYILTVDVFNEGVDIPSVNQVVMLRQTQSSVVFVQQLGRGLRKAPGKEYVVVIDFIGNYANNYLIPIALFGDDSLNKESIRRSLIAAEERGAVAGLSSVQFDRIAQQRVLQSLATTRLDSLPNLKAAVETMRNRLGRMPRLEEFLKFESVDPALLATRLCNYPNLIAKLFKVEHGLSAGELDLLTVISSEVLNARRMHEAVLLKALLTEGPTSPERIASIFRESGLPSDVDHVNSAVGSLTLDFHKKPVKSHRGARLAEWTENGSVRATSNLSSQYVQSTTFRGEVDDLIRTTFRLVVDRYDIAEPFTPARQYSRKDASRLLCWPNNEASTIYGYRVRRDAGTCPIFVTLSKTDEVSASTAYEDAILDHSTMLWFTKSNRTLASDEVKAIVGHDVDLHVFVKKSDAEDETNHYYLGRAQAEDAELTAMRSGETVVRMTLRFEHPIDPGVYNYFHPTVTD
jgi:superfamily II DNA or RNA helicase